MFRVVLLEYFSAAALRNYHDLVDSAFNGCLNRTFALSFVLEFLSGVDVDYYKVLVVE